MITIKNSVIDSMYIEEEVLHDDYVVYGYFYNPCFYESAAGLVSLHRTEEGAKLAKQDAFTQRVKDWAEQQVMFKEEGFPELYEECFEDDPYIAEYVEAIVIKDN